MLIPELAWPRTASAQKGGPDDIVLDVAAGKVVLLIRGRNAWHSTWVRHYLRNTTLFTDLESARLGAERRRERGNVFYAVEVPAIQLRSVYSLTVLCDAHPDNPFGAFTGLTPRVTPSRYGTYASGLYPGVPIRDAVEAFGHRSGFWEGSQPSEHSLRTGSLPAGTRLQELNGKLFSSKSFPQGSGYLLGWSAETNRYTPTGAEIIAKGWSDIVSAALDGPIVDDQGTAERLVAHRNDTLEAMPESRWREVREAARREAVAEQRRATSAYWSADKKVSAALAALERAEEQRRAADDARLKPATTSAKVRAQRERYERARHLVATRAEELEVAREARRRALSEMHAAREALTDA